MKLRLGCGYLTVSLYNYHRKRESSVCLSQYRYKKCAIEVAIMAKHEEGSRYG